MARRLMVVLAAGVMAFAAVALPASAKTAAARGPVLFPVVGGSSFYFDDFGDSRARHPHEGNDLLAPKFVPVVAVENGIAEPYPTARSGCMLYLISKTHEYLYIHLNNDTPTRQNVGCSKAYAPGIAGHHKVRVRAGQILGYVGNSGDAEGGPTHLHFETHSLAGHPTDPYRTLRTLPVPLFGVPVSSPRKTKARVTSGPATFWLHLSGTYESSRVLADGTGRLALRVASAVVHHPDGSVASVRRTRRVIVVVPAALVPRTLTFKRGLPLAFDTIPGTPTLARQTTEAGSWMVAAFTA